VRHDVTPFTKATQLPGHLVFARTRGHIPPNCLSAV
jgi:hypothetical protein